MQRLSFAIVLTVVVAAMAPAIASARPNVALKLDGSVVTPRRQGRRRPDAARRCGSPLGRDDPLRHRRDQFGRRRCAAPRPARQDPRRHRLRGEHGDVVRGPAPRVLARRRQDVGDAPDRPRPYGVGRRREGRGPRALHDAALGRRRGAARQVLDHLQLPGPHQVIAPRRDARRIHTAPYHRRTVRSFNDSFAHANVAAPGSDGRFRLHARGAVRDAFGQRCRDCSRYDHHQHGDRELHGRQRQRIQHRLQQRRDVRPELAVAHGQQSGRAERLAQRSRRRSVRHHEHR